MKMLVVIPARGGSKGIPGKNIKLLGGKPLITYTIDVARKIVNDLDICVSSDDDEIIKLVEDYGLKVHFKRPSSLAQDNSCTDDVIRHAIQFYEGKGVFYDVIIILQPTSPFRKEQHLNDTISLFSKEIDMVVSVSDSKTNPFYNAFEENDMGYLSPVIKDMFLIRRQDAKQVWEYNGSIYLINVDSLKSKNISDFKRVKKYVMDNLYSIDIDTSFDWFFAECVISNNMNV